MWCPNAGTMVFTTNLFFNTSILNRCRFIRRFLLFFISLFLNSNICLGSCYWFYRWWNHNAFSISLILLTCSNWSLMVCEPLGIFIEELSHIRITPKVSVWLLCVKDVVTTYMINVVHPFVYWLCFNVFETTVHALGISFQRFFVEIIVFGETHSTIIFLLLSHTLCFPLLFKDSYWLFIIKISSNTLWKPTLGSFLFRLFDNFLSNFFNLFSNRNRSQLRLFLNGSWEWHLVSILVHEVHSWFVSSSHWNWCCNWYWYWSSFCLFCGHFFSERTFSCLLSFILLLTFRLLFLTKLLSLGLLFTHEVRNYELLNLWSGISWVWFCFFLCLFCLTLFGLVVFI